jgi:hypothetical protein
MGSKPAAGDERRVDFVIGGVQKGGTTALDRLLRRHPDVAMASVKEPKWFDDDRRFAHGPPAPSGYHALFGHPQGARVRGEATPSYCWWPPAAQRIRDYSPAMKWILLFRDPVSRAYSQWNMRRTDGSAQVSFARAVDEEIRRGAEVPVRNNVGSSYLSRGFYAQQLARILDLFPREQVLTLRSEWLRDDPSATLRRVHAFLGIAPEDDAGPAEAHVGAYAEPLDAATRARLVRLFEGDVRRLEALTGWDLADWLS